MLTRSDHPAGVRAMDRDRDATPSHFSFAPARWSDIEALVGEPVECYQDIGYTEATIRGWQRRAETPSTSFTTPWKRQRAPDFGNRHRDHRVGAAACNGTS